MLQGVLTIGVHKAIATYDVSETIDAIVTKLVGNNMEFFNLWCWSYQANMSDEDELSHAELVWYECQKHNALFALKYRFIPFMPDNFKYVDAPPMSLYTMYDTYVGAPSIRRSRIQKYLWDQNGHVDESVIIRLIRSLPIYTIWTPLIDTPYPSSETPSSETPPGDTPSSRKRRARSAT